MFNNCLFKSLLFIVFGGFVLPGLICSPAFAQDERFIRDIFSHQLSRPQDRAQRQPIYTAASPYYQLDITGDGRREAIVYEKRDGQDWIHVHDSSGNQVYSYRFDTVGLDSQLYRIQRRSLSRETDAFLLYFYEGHTDYLEYHGTGRLYVMTMDRRELDSLSVYRGPIVWQERDSFRQGYWNREYTVDLQDLNDNGIREVIVQNYTLQRVLLYRGSGHWREI